MVHLRNVAQEVGVDDGGIAWGAIFFDYDGDTWADLFVANDHGPDKLYRNKGDGTFEDVSEQSGIVTLIRGKPTGAMGLCVGDYDNDKDLDLFVTNYDEDLLWRNNADGTFTNVAEEVGVANVGVGWYASFIDFDNDGYRDLYVVNGDVDNSQKTNLNRLYHNNRDGTFVDVAEELGVTSNAVARGATTGDFDNDRDIDFFIVNNTGYTLLNNELEADTRRIQANHKRILIRLIGTESNRDGIGTRVTVKYGNHVQTQELICGTGFLGSDSLELEFGLGTGYIRGDITLEWPSGIVETYSFSSGHDLYIFTEADDVVTSVEPNGKYFTSLGRIKTVEVFQNYPNPFNPETWIPYKLNESSDVKISIYSPIGELVRTFNLGLQTQGEKKFHWDGKNVNGESAASGVYFYQFDAGNTQIVRKMWLMK